MQTTHEQIITRNSKPTPRTSPSLVKRVQLVLAFTLNWLGKWDEFLEAKTKKTGLSVEAQFPSTTEFFLSLCSTLLNTNDQKKTIRRQEREGSPKCYHCDRDENITVEHFLLSCTKYEEIRSELLCQLQGELEAIGERGFQVYDKRWKGFRCK